MNQRRPSAVFVRAFAAMICGLVFAGSSAAQISYVESVDAPGGMFSTDNLNPTSIGPLGLGLNTVSGSVSNARNQNRTTDVFTFHVMAGTQLDSFIVTDFVSASTVGFAGLDTGTSYPHDAAGLDAINNTFSGYEAIGGSTFNGVVDEGTFFGTVFFDGTSNNMSSLSTQLGGPGFTAPLGEGNYTVYVQETSTAATNYEFSFAVSSAAAVPEPSSLMTVGIAGFFALRRRKRKS